MDNQQFFNYALENAQKRSFAETFVGMSGLKNYDLEVMAGKMQGALTALDKKDELEGSWAAETWGLVWSNFLGDFDGIMFAKNKAAAESRRAGHAEVLDEVLSYYGVQIPTDEQLVRLRRASLRRTELRAQETSLSQRYHSTHSSEKTL